MQRKNKSINERRKHSARKNHEDILSLLNRTGNEQQPLSSTACNIASHLKDRLFPARKRQEFIFESERVRSHSKMGAEQGKAKRKDRSEAYLMMERGKEYFKQSNTERAIKCYGMSLELNPSLFENLYLLGVAHLNLHRYAEAAACLRDLVSKAPTFKKTAFVLLGIALKKLKMESAAISALNEVLALHPDYEDALVYKAKILLNMGKLVESIEVFDRVLERSKESIVALQGKAQALRAAGRLREAILIYKHATTLSSDTGLSLKLVSCLIEHKDYEPAGLILKSLKLNSSQAQYYRGEIALRTNNPTDAFQYFEECALHNDSQKWVTLALQKMLQLKVAERDFYDARHILQRSKALNYDQSAIRSFDLFVEAVIFAMKRKFEQSESLFAQLKALSLPAFLGKLVPLYCAYSKIHLGKIQQALQLYREVKTLSPKKIDKGTLCNISTCQGILLAGESRFQQAAACFRKAFSHSKTCSQPLLYQAVALLQSASQKSLSPQVIAKAKQLLEVASGQKETSAGIWYCKALVDLRTKDLQAAREAVEKAIEKAEENMAEYYILRGLVSYYEGKVQDAVNDFSVALNIQEENEEALVYRAACNLRELNYEDAFSDINSLLTLDENHERGLQLLALAYIESEAFEDAKDVLRRLPDSRLTQSLQQHLDLLCFEFDRAGAKGELFKSLLQDRSRAVDSLTKLLQKRNKEFAEIEIRLLLGVAELYRGNLATAAKHFQYSLFLARENDGQAESRIVQLKYNLIVCYALQKQSRKAKELILQLKEETEGIEEGLDSLYGCLDGDSPGGLLQVMPFENRFCSKFQPLRLPEAAGTAVFLSFDLPKTKFDLGPLMRQKLLERLRVSSIQRRPEAPWIRRSEFGIVFTNEVVDIDYSSLEEDQPDQAGNQSQEFSEVTAS